MFGRGGERGRRAWLSGRVVHVALYVLFGRLHGVLERISALVCKI